MSEQNDCIRIGVPPEAPRGDLCADPHFEADQGISRRVFLQGMGTASITLTDARSAELQFPTAKPAGALGHPFPRGVALRVKPILVYDVPTRKDRASWRNYGGISTVEAAQGEAVRIEKELHELRDKADFPIGLQAPELLDSQSELSQIVPGDTDLFIVYAAGFCTEWPLKKSMIRP